MDVMYTTEDTWGTLSAAKKKEGPSMEDLILSMRTHLIQDSGGGGGEGAPSTSPGGGTVSPCTLPPLCSSPIDHTVAGVEVDIIPPPGNGLDFGGRETVDFTRGDEGEGPPFGRQGSLHPSDGQFTASDLPLSNGFHNADSEVTDVEIEADGHPRLRSNFYQKLREKYPRAFQRRSSITSDTASLCSEVGPSQPSSMTVMPRGQHLQHPSHEGQGPSGYGGFAPSREGLPPRPPAYSHRKYTDRQKQVDSVTKHLREDLTITGTSRRNRATGNVQTDRSMAPTQGLSDYQIHGILKRDLDVHNTSMMSESSVLDRSDSNMSLKERLHKNKLTLRALLSEENNPLRRRKKTQADLNKSFESDITLEGDLSISIETEQRHLQSAANKNGLLQIKRQPDRLEVTDVVQNGGLSQRSLADRPQQKHLGTKRYISPDSSHDSAVDMDTASLQSSPGSSDTQTTVITRPARVKSANQRGSRHGNAGLPPSGSASNYHSGSRDVVDGHLVSPREQRLRADSNAEYHMAMGMAHNSIGDSDVDSGIAQGSYRVERSRDRKDSSSSMENDQELENILYLSKVQNGHRFTTISSQDIRSAHRTRAGHGPSGGKYGPLKADHTIQPSSPAHHPREELHDGLHIGYPRKSASTQDLSQKRASPINRVRFEDEVAEDDQPLGQHHRAMSHPELSVGADVHGEPSRKESQIPSGCRALKLRGARRLTGNTSPAPSSQDGSVHHYESVREVEHEVRKHSLPPSGKAEDLKTKMQRLRSRNMTPTEVVQAAAADARLPEETTLPVHRASPVIISQNGSALRVEDSQSYLSDTLSSDNDLHNEVAYFNGFNDAWNNALAMKKSKKPWKKNKGQYNPSDQSDYLQKELSNKQTLKTSRPSSGLSEQYSEIRHTKGRLKGSSADLRDRPASCTAEINSPGARSEGLRVNRRENPYEEVDNGRIHGSRGENPYEEVRFERLGDQDQDTYAVAQKPPKPRSKKPTTNSCVVDDCDDRISVEEAPPVPERGYASDLERYKDLSGSRTSLSGKMDSFRKAAKNKWSALRRAVSLERVDRAGTSDEGGGGGLGKLKKSPSLQSLAKKINSFRKKDKAKFSGIEADMRPSQPGPHRPSRPSSAPIGRSKKHSSSMTSLTMVDSPQNFRPIGKLKQLNPDGSQILELVRPPHGPFGFYIARGNVKYGGGVFVSRLSDGFPEHFFAGLLGVGDEILEINCQPIDNLTLDEVYAMMAERHHLLIKTLPYIARKDT